MCYMIYFDNSATSLIKPDSVKRIVTRAMNSLTANPGRSGHVFSQKVASAIFETREKLKTFFHAEDYEIVFTKNCTEALNLAIFGCLNAGDHVICTCYEHNSVLRPLRYLRGVGIDTTIVEDDLSSVGENIEKYIKSNTKMIITNCVSNVTGEICDISKVGEICKSHGILYLVDGAQSSGHLDVDIKKCNIDMYAFAGHKGLLSITGVGGLVVKRGLHLKPIIYGGTGTMSENLEQPNDLPEGLEAGTIPSIPIISLGAGIEFLMKNFENIQKIEQKLSKYMLNSLKKLKFLEIYSKEDSLNVFSFNMQGIDSSELANILNDKYDICVRSGLHCAPLVHKKLGTLKRGAVRVSIDFNNTMEEIDYLITALKSIYSKI